MITITCKTCGKKIVWDDYNLTDIRCPKCREKINVHESFRRNIEIREQIAEAGVKRCPSCGAVISRLWFITCPGCNRWIFGTRSINGKWFTALVFFILYLIFSAIFIVYLR